MVDNDTFEQWLQRNARRDIREAIRYQLLDWAASTAPRATRSRGYKCPTLADNTDAFIRAVEELADFVMPEAKETP